MSLLEKLIGWQDFCDDKGAMGGIAKTIIGAVIAVIVLTSQLPTITSNINTAQSDANISVIPGGSAMLGIVGLLVLAIVVFAFLKSRR